MRRLALIGGGVVGCIVPFRLGVGLFLLTKVTIEASDVAGGGASWTPLGAPVSTDPPANVGDPDWTAHSSRFYRVRVP